jgi:hypothetical protein
MRNINLSFLVLYHNAISLKLNQVQVIHLIKCYSHLNLRKQLNYPNKESKNKN